jgi:hypothetical protein
LVQSVQLVALVVFKDGLGGHGAQEAGGEVI